MEKKKGGIWYAALLFVVLIWGLDPAVNSFFYRYYSAAVLISICTFASALFFWVNLLLKKKRLTLASLKLALPISLLNALGCLLQRIGLQYTTPANYAFLEHLSCVTVPLMMFLLARRKPSGMQILGCLLCLGGCSVLTGIWRGGFALGIGVLLCGAAGLLLGIATAATGLYSPRLDPDLFMPIYMTCYFLTGLLMAFALHFIRINGAPMERAVFTADPLLLLAATLFGLLSVGLCWLLRTKALGQLEPAFVAVVSPLSAVVTGVVSVLFGLDRPSLSLLLGGLLILSAALLSEIKLKKKALHH